VRLVHSPIRAPRGNTRTAKGWIQEAAKRMLMNNLDPEVAESRKSSSSMADEARRRATGSATTPSSKRWNVSEMNKRSLCNQARQSQSSIHIAWHPEC